MTPKDGMNYAPKGIAEPVVQAGTFKIAVIGLDHGHIFGMCNGLCEAGAELKSVYDRDPEKIAAFCRTFPEAKPVDQPEQILADPEIRLVVTAAIPSDRPGIGVQVMQAGKDCLSDKPPVTTLEHLDLLRETVQETGRKYAVYYSERLHSESAVYAARLIEQGAIGKVIQITGFGPHRINAAERPTWFFSKKQYGGILCDIGSHQIEQFLFFSGSTDAEIVSSQIANYHHPQYPGLDDFGDANLVGNQGVSGYFRVDWFTPDGLGTWGDGRTFILGTEGYLELRKYVDIARSQNKDHVYLVNNEGEFYYDVDGKIGYPYFRQLILDCLQRSEHAMTQVHAFKAAELAVKAQMLARKLHP